MTKYTIKPTTQFKKDLKIAEKSHRNISLYTVEHISIVVETLSQEENACCIFMIEGVIMDFLLRSNFWAGFLFVKFNKKFSIIA